MTRVLYYMQINMNRRHTLSK